MKKEYLILDNKNQWLYTGTNKKETMQAYKELLNFSLNSESYGDFEEVGEEIYLYQSKLIKINKLNTI